MGQNAPGLQERTLRAFTLLYHLREDWGGELILCCGLGPDGAALSLAANIAGAACLSIEPDPVIARQALRNGACDFVVNSIDEALRALKNEIRRRRPLSVGLQGDRAPILQELIDRGIAPKLFSDMTEGVSLDYAFDFKRHSGTQIIDFNQSMGSTEAGGLEAIEADNFIQTILDRHQWHLASFAQPTLSALHAFDARALTVINPEDSMRRRWLQLAPKVLPRELPLRRCLFVSSQESELLAHSEA